MFWTKYAFFFQVNTTLKEIDLSSQENTIAKNLSGGQKRKLCVGIALIGDPKVSILLLLSNFQ